MRVFAAPVDTPYALRDWAKIPLILAGKYPRPLPPQRVVTNDSLLEFDHWLAHNYTSPRVAIDVEGRDEVEIIGLASARWRETLLIPWKPLSPAVKLYVGEMIDTLFLFTPIVGHWVARDIALLADHCGLRWEKALRIDDSGIAHAVRWPGQPHSLVHATSVYGQYPLVKGTERHTQGDVLGCLDVHYGLRRDGWTAQMEHRYDWHREKTLPEAIRGWREGKVVDYRASVDATWKLDTDGDIRQND